MTILHTGAILPVKTLESLTVTPAALADMTVNGTQAVALKVIANYMTGTVASTEEVTSQATVTASAGTYASGVYTAAATAGAATLTVSFGGKTGTITVNVTAEAPKVSTVTVAALSVAEYQDGTLSVTVKDQFGAAMTTGYTLSYVSGNTNVATVASTGVVTALGYNSSATTATITVTATPTVAGGTAVTGTGTVTVTQDTTKPTLTAVNVVSNKQLNLVFSEKLNATNAVLAGNYKIYYNGSLITLTTTGTANVNSKQIKVDLTLGEDKKTVRLTILSATESGNPVGGFILDGFLTADYSMYLVQGEAVGSQVSDLAGNVAIANQNIAFKGVTTPDSTAPVITSASYNVDDNKLTINFDKFVKLAAADVDLTKVTLNGITLAATDFGSPTPSDQGSTVTFTITTAKADSIEVATTYVINFAAAAFKDLAGNTNLAQSNVTITYAAKVAPTAVTYNENTSILQVTFNREVKVASLTDFSKVSLLDGTTSKVSSLAGAELLTLTNNATIQFKLTQAMKVAFQGATGTAPTAPKVTFAADFATDTLATPTKNALVTKDVTYTEDTTKPTLTKVEYNADTKRLIFTLSKAVYTGKTYTSNIVPASLVIYNDTTTLFNVGQILNLNDGNGSKALENIGFAATATLPEIKAVETSTTLTFALSATNDSTRIAAIESVSDRTKLKVAIAADSIRDFNYNGIAVLEKGTTTDTRATLSYVATEGPSVSSFATNANYGTVVFDKPMSRTSVQAGTYNIYLKSNSAVTMTVDSVRLARDNKTAYVFYKTTAGYNVPVNASDYTVVATNVVDELNNAIKTTNDANKKDATCSTAAVTPKVNLTANTDLSVVDNGDGVLGAGDTFTLSMNAPVKFATSASDAQKIGSLQVNSQADFAGTGRTFGTGATVAISSDYPNEITVTLGTSSTIALGTDYLDINATPASVYIQSIATSTTASTYDNTHRYKLVAPTAYATAPKVTTSVYKDTNADGVVNAGDELVVTFDQAMDKTYTSVATACFTLSANSLGTGPLTGTWSTDAKTVTLVLGTGASIVPNANSIKAAGTIKNAWAVVADGSGTAVLITPNDSVAPKLLSAVWTKNASNLNPNVPEKGDIVTLTFSKPITLAAASKANFDVGATTMFTGASAIFDMADNTANAPTITKTSSTTVALRIGASPAFTAGTTTLTIRTGGAYMAGGADKIVDAYNNPAVTDAAVTITKGTSATTAVVATRAELTAALADTTKTLVVLDGDIAAGTTTLVNNDMVLDLNGKTLTTGAAGHITITANNATIKNGKINNEANAINVTGAGTNAKFYSVEFLGTAAISNITTTGRTYEKVTFNGANFGLVATVPLTLKGVTVTLDATLTTSDDITVSGDISIAATKTLTVVGANTKKITGSGSEKITGAGTFATGTTAATVEKLVVESIVSTGIATTFKSVNFAPTSATAVGFGAATTLDTVTIGANATVSGAANTVTVSGPVTVNGTVNFTTGKIDVTGGASAATVLTINGGKFQVSAADVFTASAHNVTLTAAATKTATITATANTYTVTGGAAANDAILDVPASGTLTIAAGKNLIISGANSKLTTAGKIAGANATTSILALNTASAVVGNALNFGSSLAVDTQYLVATDVVKAVADASTTITFLGKPTPVAAFATVGTIANNASQTLTEGAGVATAKGVFTVAHLSASANTGNITTAATTVRTHDFSVAAPAGSTSTYTVTVTTVHVD